MKNINFNNAIEIIQGLEVKQNKRSKEMIQEFLTSTCDLFSFQDWQYYADETGKSIDWLRSNAKYNDNAGEYGSMLDNAIIDNDHELMESFFI